MEIFFSRNISQGSAATYSRYDRIFGYHFTRRLLLRRTKLEAAIQWHLFSEHRVYRVTDTMVTSGNWLLVQRIVTTTLYKLLRLVFVTVQSIFWQLNGTAGKLREARLPQNYEQSVQVLDVRLVHKFSIIETITVDNFLCTHNRFEHPQYIIDNDHVTLMTINERDAVFCEPAKKGMMRTKIYRPSFEASYLCV